MVESPWSHSPFFFITALHCWSLPAFGVFADQPMSMLKKHLSSPSSSSSESALPCPSGVGGTLGGVSVSGSVGWGVGSALLPEEVLLPPPPSPRKSKTSSQLAACRQPKNSVTAASWTPVMAAWHSEVHRLVSPALASRQSPAFLQKSPQGFATPGVTGSGWVQTGISGMSTSMVPPGVPGAGAEHC